MSIAQPRWWYVPPVDALYDFDDCLVDDTDRASAKRWLAGFNGRVGEPAENVQLAWRAPTGAQVAIGTFHPRAHEDSTNHRATAAWMLDSVQFYQPGPPGTRTLMGADHLKQISQDDSLWLAADFTVNGRKVPLSVATISGVTIGHTPDGTVIVAHRGLPPEQLSVRALPNHSQGYRVDPWQPQTTTALQSEWNQFFADRPDLAMPRWSPDDTNLER